jgi:hypothetical protein
VVHLTIPRLNLEGAVKRLLSWFADIDTVPRHAPLKGFLYAERLNCVDEAPEALRDALLLALKPNDRIKLLICNPAQIHPDETFPSTLLAISDRSWIIVAACEDARTKAHRCDFADTIVVQITSILLYGALRIDFFERGQPQSYTIHFNAVREAFHREALVLILRGIENSCNFKSCCLRDHEDGLRALPLKFRNALLRYLPPEQATVDIEYWPTVFTKRLKLFLRELTPATVLILTSGHLVWISEEKALWPRRPRANGKYGCVVTYYPLSRIQHIQSRKNRGVCTIDLDLASCGNNAIYSIDIPNERGASVSALMDLALDCHRTW